MKNYHPIIKYDTPITKACIKLFEAIADTPDAIAEISEYSASNVSWVAYDLKTQLLEIADLLHEMKNN